MNFEASSFQFSFSIVVTRPFYIWTFVNFKIRNVGHSKIWLLEILTCTRVVNIFAWFSPHGSVKPKRMIGEQVASDAFDKCAKSIQL